MKVFNKDKALRQIKLKQNKNTYIKRISIVLSCFILLIGVMYFTFAKFEQNSEEYTLINGKVKYGGSGDIQLSYVVDGVSQSVPPAKGTGYKLKSIDCTNGIGTWDKNSWSINIANMTGKVKCNLEFEELTAVVVTMYGPPGAVISFTDDSGYHIETLDNTGKAEDVEIGIMDNVVFTDTTVAKDPNNLSNNYTKTMDITEDTTEIYIMPNKALYWYGYKSSDTQVGIGWSLDTSSQEVIFNTNDISTGQPGNNITWSSRFVDVIDISEVSSINGILDGTKVSKNFTSTNATKHLDIVCGHYKDNSINRYQTAVSLTNIPPTNTGYDTIYHNTFVSLFESYNKSNLIISAIWLE